MEGRFYNSMSLQRLLRFPRLSRFLRLPRLPGFPKLRKRQRLWRPGTRKNIVVEANADASKKLSVNIINQFLISSTAVEYFT
jgi:hypothetical protein